MEGSVILDCQIGMGGLRADPVLNGTIIQQAGVDTIQVGGECVHRKPFTSVQPGFGVGVVGMQAIGPGQKVAIPRVLFGLCVEPATIGRIDINKAVSFKGQYS